MRTQQNDKTGGEASGETSPADSLISDSQPAGPGGNQLLLFLPTSVRYFVAQPEQINAGVGTEGCGKIVWKPSLSPLSDRHRRHLVVMDVRCSSGHRELSDGRCRPEKRQKRPRKDGRAREWKEVHRPGLGTVWARG